MSQGSSSPCRRKKPQPSTIPAPSHTCPASFSRKQCSYRAPKPTVDLESDRPGSWLCDTVQITWPLCTSVSSSAKWATGTKTLHNCKSMLLVFTLQTRRQKVRYKEPDPSLPIHPPAISFKSAATCKCLPKTSPGIDFAAEYLMWWNIYLKFRNISDLTWASFSSVKLK